MKLVNAVEIARSWQQIVNGTLVQIVIMRHASKDPNGGLRAGLSTIGRAQVELCRRETMSFFMGLIEQDRLRLCASSASRCIETLIGLMPRLLRQGISISLPPSLDVPYFGVDDADYRAILAFAEREGISQKEASLRLDESGYVRTGEKPADVRERMIHGLLDEARIARERRSLVVYCGHSPEMEDALGIERFLAELETVAFALDGDSLHPLIRFKPEFGE